MSEKIAPVQGYPRGIPWEMHLRAYDAYCAKWSPQPALIDLEGRNCRGGFSVGELDMFIPGWREELTERTAMLKQIAALEAALDLALEALGRWEPNDSRAVSGEFVALAAIRAGDHSPEMVAFVQAARQKVAALPPPPPPEITVTYVDEVAS